MDIKTLFFKNNSINFDYLKVRPTKNIIRTSVFSTLNNYVTSLYVIDLFCGSCIFSFEFIINNVKKVLSIDIEKKIIDKSKKFFFEKKIFNFNEFILFNFNSLFFIKRFILFNFSFIVFDPPFKTDRKIYISEFYRIFFLRQCVIFYFEFSIFFYSNYFFNDFFLIKKSIIGNVMFFLIKKF